MAIIKQQQWFRWTFNLVYRVINQMTLTPTYNLSCLRRIWGDGGDPCQDEWSDRQQRNGNEAYGKRLILHSNTSSSNNKNIGSDDDDMIMMTMIKRQTLAWETNSLSWSKKKKKNPLPFRNLKVHTNPPAVGIRTEILWHAQICVFLWLSEDNVRNWHCTVPNGRVTSKERSTN